MPQEEQCHSLYAKFTIEVELYAYGKDKESTKKEIEEMSKDLDFYPDLPDGCPMGVTITKVERNS